MANRSSNRAAIPEAKSALDRFKYEVASEIGVPLKDGYNGDLTSRQNGSVGGYMVKKMIEAQEKQIETNAPNIMNLSASGSMNFPNVVTSPRFLAMFPSKKSVIAAIMNIAAATIRDAVYVDSVAEAAAYLQHTEGNILLTTGSKVLPFQEERY